ncbi:hypothetical protein VB711_20960, partial [Cronbergia sp. UHCC 0137]|uniref:hypothetical protein n=1 Tax=Cronbergia sp. UHCC 0137 TaxID=3110239 RepID=UPI002B1EE902
VEGRSFFGVGVRSLFGNVEGCDSEALTEGIAFWGCGRCDSEALTCQFAFWGMEGDRFLRMWEGDHEARPKNHLLK